MHIEIPYTPRPFQQELHDLLDQHRFAVLNCHRRFGKTVCILNHLIKAALTNPLPNPRFAYVAPTYKQAKSIAWDYIKQFTAKIPGTKYNETELRCDLPNGSRITLLSGENAESIRGIFLDGVCIDETAQVNPKLWNEILRPALSDRKGFCYFIGTPAGMNNFFYEIHQHAVKDKSWLAYTAPVSKTNIIDQEELDAARAQMGENKYKQEFECDWIANIEGSVYGDIIKKIEQEWFFKTTYKKKRILEKSPNYVMILELVNKLFPNSLHICVLRDPRAVVNSFARLIKNSPKTTGKVLRKGDTILRFNGYEKISNLPTYEIFSWQMEKILEYSDAFKKKVNGRLSFWYHENIYEDLPYYLKKLTKRLDIEFPKLIKYFTSEYIEKNYPWWRNEKLKKDPFYTNFLTDREISTLKRLDVLSKKMGYDENVVGKLNKRIYEI